MTDDCDIKNPLIRDGVSQIQRISPVLNPDYIKLEERQLSDWLVYAERLSEQINYYSSDSVDGNWQDFFANITSVTINKISRTSLLELQSKNIELQWLDIRNWYQSLDNSIPFKLFIKNLVFINLKIDLDQNQNLRKTFDNIKKPDGSKPSQEFLSPTYSQIIRSASQNLDSNLGISRDPPPYIALYLAFIELMKKTQEDLNQITRRHLDFFYQDVLRLSKQIAKPDSTYLIFKLAKFQSDFKLEADTRFKAGRDATGKERFYKLDEEIVIHNAQIVSLKGLFLDSQELSEKPPKKNILGLYGSPVANSFDGHDGEFPKEQEIKKWLPFGKKNSQSSVKLGLAIASDIFLLQEGLRIITFEFRLTGTIPQIAEGHLPKIFQIYFSGEKEWIKGEVQLSSQLSNTELRLVVKLSPDDAAIVPYHPQLEGAKLDTTKPVARLVLDTQTSLGNLSVYHYFRQVEFTNLEIRAYVKDVKTLILQNDLSVGEAGKPFQPFGFTPTKGSAFYIGSQEVFQKDLTELYLNIEWEGFPENQDKAKFLKEYYRGYYLDNEPVNEYYRGYYSDDEPVNGTNRVLAKDYFSQFAAKVELLKHKSWSSEDCIEKYDLFTSPPPVNLIQKDKTFRGEAIKNLTPFSLASRSGFLRLTLKQSFLHNEFPQKYRIQTLASAQDYRTGRYVDGAVYEVIDKPVFSEPRDPYVVRWKHGDDRLDTTRGTTVSALMINEAFTPVIRSLSIDYTAIADLGNCKLFHLHPFDGFAELDTQDNFLFPLFPQFLAEGELLIGLKDLEPPTSLSLLFQMAEDTAELNSFINKPYQVNWYYLRDNTWKSFLDTNNLVQDETNNLVSSGIVFLKIPDDISREHTTILDPNLHWIKVSAPARSQAVNQIINIHTQAARVTFIDEDNDPNHFANPLPLRTINRLEVVRPEIKSIEQPYLSFGGQLQEGSEQFYTRVSEHLHHKGRAITIFDYEHLVLANFPEIQKVRCINHASVDKGNLNEFSSGSVTLVVIPRLAQHLMSNNLEPKTNINIQQRIKNYLKQLSSTWTRIYVTNPIYEPVQVKAEIQLKSQYKKNFAYYRREIAKEIVGFLAPWTIDSNAEILFSNKIHISSIVKILEKLNYVENVSNVELSLPKQNINGLQEAIASTAHTIFTSILVEEQEKTIYE